MSTIQAIIGVDAVFSCSAFPNPAEGISFNGSGVPAQAVSEITVVGGVGPFTHSGSFISGGTGILISGSTTTTPGWSTADDSVQVRTGVYRHTVTDTGAGSATTFVDITVNLEVTT